jgi:hypothetical protein
VQPKSEIRSSKSETNPKSEFRNAQNAPRTPVLKIASFPGFEFVSDFDVPNSDEGDKDKNRISAMG